MSLSTTPFAFVKKFSGHGAYTLTLTPIAGGEPMVATRSLSIKSSRLSPSTLAKPAGQLSLDGVDVNYNLVAGGWKGEKTYYVYVTKNERSCFFPLSGTEYAAFKTAKATLTAVPKPVVVAPEGPAIEVTEQPPAQPVDEAPESPSVDSEVKPKATPRRAERRAKSKA